MEPLGDDQLVEQGRGDDIDVVVLREIGQIVLIRGKVKNGIDTSEERCDEVSIAHVALVEVDLPAHVLRWTSTVNWGGERVEHNDVVPQGQQAIARVRTDEAGTSGNENPHPKGSPHCPKMCGRIRNVGSPRGAM